MIDRDERHKAWTAGYYFGAIVTVAFFVLALVLSGRGIAWLFR